MYVFPRLQAPGAVLVFKHFRYIEGFPCWGSAESFLLPYQSQQSLVLLKAHLQALCRGCSSYVGLLGVPRWFLPCCSKCPVPLHPPCPQDCRSHGSCPPLAGSGSAKEADEDTFICISPPHLLVSRLALAVLSWRARGGEKPQVSAF